MNDGKLPQDDLKTFDDWKQSSGCISTSVGSYPRMTYPSPTFHTTVFALSGVVIWRFRVDISRCVNINTLTSRLCVTPSTPSQRTCNFAWLPTKRGRPSKAKSAKARQPGEMPSPEKVRKSARVEENNEEEDRPTRNKVCILSFFFDILPNPYLGLTIAN